MKKLLLLLVVLVLASCKKEDGPKPAHDPYTHPVPLGTADLVKTTAL